jgi:hypothetical protein
MTSEGNLLMEVQSKTFAQILHGVNEGQLECPTMQASQIGSRIKRRLNARLIADCREPIQLQDHVVGFLALIYAAENDISIDEVLTELRNETMRVKATG